MQLDISDKAWDNFVEIIQKAIQTNNEYFRSLADRKRYFIPGFTPTEKIIIRRESGEDSELGRRGFLRFLSHFDNKTGVFQKSKYKGNSTKMSAIVHFHPDLQLSTDRKMIYVDIENDQNLQLAINDLVIPDDDINVVQNIARNIRRGQSKFRTALIKVYNGKCCITNCDVLEVLDACHIESHSTKGINQVGNGILLRTDLHNLFDCGLIFIDPQTHLLHLSPKLKNTSYWIYNGMNVNVSNVNNGYLEDRWLEKSWK